MPRPQPSFTTELLQPGHCICTHREAGCEQAARGWRITLGACQLTLPWHGPRLGFPKPWFEFSTICEIAASSGKCSFRSDTPPPPPPPPTPPTPPNLVFSFVSGGWLGAQNSRPGPHQRLPRCVDVRHPRREVHPAVVPTIVCRHTATPPRMRVSQREAAPLVLSAAPSKS